MKNILYENKLEPFQLSIVTGLLPQPHIHKEVELIYVEEGYATAYADKKCYHLKKGELFISFPNQVHYYESSINGIYYLAIINPNALFELKDILYNNIPVSNIFNSPKMPKISNILNSAITSENGDFSNTLKSGLLNQAFGLIMPDLPLKPRIKTDNSTLNIVLKYCIENFSDDITLDSISRNLHMNKYHISHLLSQKLGISFNSYINMLRVDKACELLEETDKKTADISEEVGFGSIRSFNRAFTKILNITPLKYRNQYKTKNNV